MNQKASNVSVLQFIKVAKKESYGLHAQFLKFRINSTALS